jgi:hypothetical protein
MLVQSREKDYEKHVLILVFAPGLLYCTVELKQLLNNPYQFAIDDELIKST